MRQVHHNWPEVVVAGLAALLCSCEVGAQQITLLQQFAAPDIRNPMHLVTDGVDLFIRDQDAITTEPLVLSMPITGGAPVELYRAQGAPDDIEVLGDDLIWMDPNGGPITDTRIYRAPKHGGGPVTYIYTGSSVGQPIVDGIGLATDGALLYTSDEVQGRLHMMSPTGSGLVQIGSRYGGFFDQEHMNRIDWDAGVLYIVDAGCARPGCSLPPDVLSMTAPGPGQPIVSLYQGAPLVQPTDILTGDGVLYVSDPDAGQVIWELPLTGGTPTALVAGAPFVRVDGLDYHDGSLFVADSGNYQSPGGAWVDGDGAIYEIDVDGLDITRVDTAAIRVAPGQVGHLVTLALTSSSPNARSIDAANLRFLDPLSADVTAEYAIVADPGNPTVLAAGGAEILTFAVDVLPGATLGFITIDGTVDFTDMVSGRFYAEDHALVTAQWEVVPCPTTLCGDCNEDGRIDLLDALTAAQHAAGLMVLSGAPFSNCNVNGEGEPSPAAVVDVLDALTIARYSVGLPVTLVCC